MSADDLLCAACSGIVEQGRCPTCRASREYLRRTTPSLPAGPLLLAALVLLLLLLTLTH